MLSIILFLFALTICVAVHEIGHATAIMKAGIKPKEIGIGIPIIKWLGFSFKAPEWFPAERIGLNLLLIGGYTLPAEYQEDQIRNLSYWQKANIYGSGIWANFLLALGILIFLALIHFNAKSLRSALVLSIIFAVIYFGRKWFNGIIFPLLIPPPRLC